MTAAVNDFRRYLTGMIEERRQLYATSPDSCPDDILTACISRDPPVSKTKGAALPRKSSLSSLVRAL